LLHFWSCWLKISVCENANVSKVVVSSSLHRRERGRHVWQKYQLQYKPTWGAG